MSGEGLPVRAGCKGWGLGGVTVPRGGLALLWGGLCTRLQSRCFAPTTGPRRSPCWEGLCPQGSCMPMGEEVLSHCKTGPKNSLGQALNKYYPC